MSLPASRQPGNGGRWETIRYALDTNPRTFRLCLILFVVTAGPCVAAVITELARHILLSVWWRPTLIAVAFQAGAGEDRTVPGVKVTCGVPAWPPVGAVG
jgi:hypothetical protein